MWLASLLLLPLLPSVLAYTCGVTEEFYRNMREKTNASRNLQQDLSMRFPRNETLAPLRIWVEYGDMSGLSESQSAHLTDTILPSAINWYQNMLQVHSVKGKVVVPMKLCGSFSVPLSHQLTGVEADYILYVYAKASDAAYTATAFACAFDGGHGNPVAGMIEYNPNKMTGMAIENEIQVARHELAHALGFDSSLHHTYRGKNNTHYTMPVTSVTLRGYTNLQLSTPMVTEMAQLGFGCLELTGVPFEGTNGEMQHWNKRIMVNDFMTADFGVADVIYSNISLAVFEDSGWYQVDYNYTDNIFYGNDAGCSWFTSPCVTRDVPNFPEFCSSTTADTCDFLHNRKGKCNLSTTLKDLSSHFQYFTNPTTGGTDAKLDYCPIVVPDSNGDCKGRDITKMTINSDYGETLGDESRCFTGNYKKGGVTTTIHSGCHNVTCELGTAFVKVGSVKVACPVPGGNIDIARGDERNPKESFEGEIWCPPYDILCGYRPCINGCSGNGVCGNGGCYCNDGYSGVDCSIVCHDTCRSCTSPLATDCDSCYANANVTITITSPDIITSECLCNIGYAYNTDSLACEKILCHESCQECAGTEANNCVACHESATLTPLGECVCNAGFYLTAIQMCGQCHETCLSCSGMSTTECLTCPGNLVLQDDFSCLCAPGSHFNRYIKLCISDDVTCAVTCDTCKGPEPTDCTSCAPNSDLKEGSCLCTTGFFPVLSETTFRCDYVCDVTCSVCSGPFPSNCTTCVDLSMNHTASVGCACKTGYVFNAIEKKCKATFTCDPMCKTCHGPASNQCDSCGLNFNLMGTNACECKPGFVQKGTLCLLCHPTCATCTGTLENVCVSCHSNAALPEGATTGKCTCNDGFYLSADSTCGKCMTPCATCVNPVACTSCKAAYTTLTSVGLCVCPSHTYLTSTGDFCDSCNANCKECSGPGLNQCKTCYAGMSLNTVGLCVCPPGQAIVSPGVCGACNASCLTCSTNSNECLSCDLTVASLQGTTCVCKSAAYASASGQCRACHSSCLTCKGGNEDQCLSCISNAGLRKGQCLCKYGYYMTDDMTACKVCHDTCGSCVGPSANDCDSCRIHAHLQSDGMQSNCECDDGYFLDLKTLKCKTCDYSCMSCSGPNPTDCTDCPPGFTLDKGVCSGRRLLAELAPVPALPASTCSGVPSDQSSLLLLCFCLVLLTLALLLPIFKPSSQRLLTPMTAARLLATLGSELWVLSQADGWVGPGEGLAAALAMGLVCSVAMRGIEGVQRKWAKGVCAGFGAIIGMLALSSLPSACLSPSLLSLWLMIELLVLQPVQSLTLSL